MSLTGLFSLENEGNITLFRMSSIGDLFKQSLRKKNKEIKLHLNENDLEIIERWEENCENLICEEETFVTGILNDNHLLEACQNNGAEEYEETIENINMDNAEWSISKEELTKYIDYLAPRIIKEWNIDGMEEWSKNTDKLFIELSSDDEDDVAERVALWIEKHSGVLVEDEKIESTSINKEENIVPNNARLEETIKTDDAFNTPSFITPTVNTHIVKNVSTSNNTPFAKSVITKSTPRKKFISGF